MLSDSSFDTSIGARRQALGEATKLVIFKARSLEASLRAGHLSALKRPPGPNS